MFKTIILTKFEYDLVLGALKNTTKNVAKSRMLSNRLEGGDPPKMEEEYAEQEQQE
jgi:hypothetical protein